MTQISGIQIAGSTSGNNPEVELNSLAARFTSRPGDFNLTSAGSVCGGTLTGGTPSTNASSSGSNAFDAVFAFQWGDPTRICVVKRFALDFAMTTNRATWQARLFKSPFMSYIFPWASAQIGAQNRHLSTMVGSQGRYATGVSPGTGDSSGSMSPVAIGWTTGSGTQITGSFGNDPQQLSHLVGSQIAGNSSVTLAQQHLSQKPFGHGVGLNYVPGLGGNGCMIEARHNEQPVVLEGGEGLLLQLLTDANLGYSFLANVYWEEYALVSPSQSFY